LCAHNRHGVERLAARPLASGSPASRIRLPKGLHAAGSIGGAVHATEAVATIAAHVTVTYRFIMFTPSASTVPIWHERQINSPSVARPLLYVDLMTGVRE
jgi:hypothetical protein